MLGSRDYRSVDLSRRSLKIRKFFTRNTRTILLIECCRFLFNFCFCFHCIFHTIPYLQYTQTSTTFAIYSIFMAQGPLMFLQTVRKLKNIREKLKTNTNHQQKIYFTSILAILFNEKKEYTFYFLLSIPISFKTSHFQHTFFSL